MSISLAAQRNFLLPLLSALAMSVGWGWRGDYGHEAGAMVPGALLALAICLAAGRADWWERAAVLALLGAVGWAFGGQMSYGLVIGYTAHSSLLNVWYGYAGLFVIGALWGGIGGGILGLGLSWPRSALERFVGPLAAFYVLLTALHLSGVIEGLSERWSLNDTDWVVATATLLLAGIYAALRPAARPACLLIGVLALGWWLGLALLTGLLGLRMTPPRGDNWAGCVGLFVALAIYLVKTQQRAALRLALYGLLAGGLGFALADWLNMAGRAKWGWLGSSWTLSGLDSWKWMEQSFGLLMGLGVALGARHLANVGLAAPKEDAPNGWLRTVAVAFLFIAVPWENFSRNVETWRKAGWLDEQMFRLGPGTWIGLVAALLAGVLLFALWQHRRGALALVPAAAFGRAQLLFLLLLWLALVGDFTRALPVLKNRGVLFVHVSFWLTALACSALVLWLQPVAAAAPATVPANSTSWRMSRWYWLAWLGVPLLLFIVAKLTVAMHSEPLPGSHTRWPIT